MVATDLLRRTVQPPEPVAEPLVSAAERRRRDLRVSGSLLTALLVTIAGMHVILQGIAWWFELAMLCVVLLGVAALVRRVSERRFLAPLAAAAVLVVILTLFFVPQSAFFGLIPTGASLSEFGVLLDEAGVSIAQQSLPAVATTPIAFLLCLGVGVIAVLADAFANAARTPALAGVPLLILLAVPSGVTSDITDPVIFAFAALAYLALLRADRPRRQQGLTVALSAVVVVGSLVVPALLPDVTPAINTNGTGFSSGVNPVLTLGDSLRRDVEHTVLDYATESGTAQYLRLVSLENFSGSDWEPDKFTIHTGNRPQDMGNVPGLSGKVKTKKETSYITVLGLTSPWLPLPYPTSSVQGLTGEWYWDANGLAVRSPNRTTQGESYTATSIQINPTPVQLESAGTTVPADYGRFLALPDNLPSIISDTAQSVAGGASTNYEKALLLQKYFRDGDFSYSEAAPVKDGYDGTGMDVIAAFLKQKAGYCVHFASAMAVMARSLGIPSRVAVGFLPGTKLPDKIDGRTAYSVTSHDLHSWPELYFEGIGWTRFEPTPSRGDVPSYADLASPGVPTPINSSTPTVPSPTASSSAAPTRRFAEELQGQSGSSASATSQSNGWLWLLIAAAAAGVLAVVPAAMRSASRRRRLRLLRGGRSTAIEAWREVLQTAADLGIQIPNTATPRDAAVLLRESVRVGVTDEARAVASVGGRIPPEEDCSRDAGISAIDRLRSAVEWESYAPAGSVARPDLAADTARIIADLRASSSRPRRIRAQLLPPSIWARIFPLSGLAD
jgi:transglutaminase-like putative cysteine protease